jgi:hypothetical protein
MITLDLLNQFNTQFKEVSITNEQKIFLSLKNFKTTDQISITDIKDIENLLKETMKAVANLNTLSVYFFEPENIRLFLEGIFTFLDTNHSKINPEHYKFVTPLLEKNINHPAFQKFFISLLNNENFICKLSDPKNTIENSYVSKFQKLPNSHSIFKFCAHFNLYEEMFNFLVKFNDANINQLQNDTILYVNPLSNISFLFYSYVSEFPNFNIVDLFQNNISKVPDLNISSLLLFHNILKELSYFEHHEEQDNSIHKLNSYFAEKLVEKIKNYLHNESQISSTLDHKIVYFEIDRIYLFISQYAPEYLDTILNREANYYFENNDVKNQLLMHVPPLNHSCHNDNPIMIEIANFHQDKILKRKLALENNAYYITDWFNDKFYYETILKEKLSHSDIFIANKTLELFDFYTNNLEDIERFFYFTPHTLVLKSFLIMSNKVNKNEDDFLKFFILFSQGVNIDNHEDSLKSRNVVFFERYLNLLPQQLITRISELLFDYIPQVIPKFSSGDTSLLNNAITIIDEHHTKKTSSLEKAFLYSFAKTFDEQEFQLIHSLIEESILKKINFQKTSNIKKIKF